jgi:amino acid transporter
MFKDTQKEGENIVNLYLLTPIQWFIQIFALFIFFFFFFFVILGIELWASCMRGKH